MPTIGTSPMSLQFFSGQSETAKESYIYYYYSILYLMQERQIQCYTISYDLLPKHMRVMLYFFFEEIAGWFRVTVVDFQYVSLKTFVENAFWHL